MKERFEAHLVKRYGADWKTMKIKESHPSLSSSIEINNGLWDVEISKNWDVEILKEYGSWNVWNKNGLLYREGVWVERLEDEEINIKASETQIGGSTIQKWQFNRLNLFTKTIYHLFRAIL